MRETVILIGLTIGAALAWGALYVALRANRVTR
jgi:hypothetical protein